MVLPDSKFECNGSIKQEVPSTKFFTAPSEGVVASPVHTLPSTSYVRKQNAEEPTKDRNGKNIENQTMASEKTIDLKTTGKLNADKVHSVEVKNVTKVDRLNFSRPSNPFAKSSSNQENSSLFDSLKKMKKADKGKS